MTDPTFWALALGGPVAVAAALAWGLKEWLHRRQCQQWAAHWRGRWLEAQEKRKAEKAPETTPVPREDSPCPR